MPTSLVLLNVSSVAEILRANIFIPTQTQQTKHCQKAHIYQPDFKDFHIFKKCYILSRINKIIKEKF